MKKTTDVKYEVQYSVPDGDTFFCDEDVFDTLKDANAYIRDQLKDRSQANYRVVKIVTTYEVL